jgi:hypothetical protein
VQVTVSGAGFGSAQGTGTVWLGNRYGTVMSWSDTQVVATVAPNAMSGNVQVQQGGASSNAVPFSVATATIASVAPASGVPGTQVAIAGSGFGAAQGNGLVWLGTVPGVVQSWSDGQILAVVVTGSASGSARVLQNGVMSDPVPFTVNSLQLTSISPTSGAVGTAVTFTGAGFGDSQGSGEAWLGSMDGQIVNWSDTQIVATVATGALTGIARVQQNGVWSNAATFTVPGPDGLRLEPALINMVVGDTHPMQAVNAAWQRVTGLTWASSDPAVVSLSTDDPPVLTALAAGHVTITAGAASADVTVWAGELPVGTVLWSNAGIGSGAAQTVPQAPLRAGGAAGVSGFPRGRWGATPRQAGRRGRPMQSPNPADESDGIRIVPAVPSPSGVADVFALNDETVQAITSDGTTAWTEDKSQSGAWWGTVPDFQGGLVLYNTYPGTSIGTSIVGLDGLTGQPKFTYTPQGGDLGFAGWVLSFTELVVHPDGTILTFLGTHDGDGNGFSWVVGIDSTTGALKFSVPMPHAENSYGIIIAGDGYAYAPYATRDISNSGEGDNWSCSQFNHFRVLRIDTSGSYADIDVMDFPSRCTGDLPPPFEGIGMITNADQGVLLTWNTRDGSPDSGASYMATITGTGVSVTEQPVGTGIIDPVLQAQDGSYIGMVYTGPNALNMIAFDASGGVRWMAPGNWQPQIATADGGLIATDDSGAAVTFDQNGNATGQMASLPTYSWTLNAYQLGSLDQVLAIPLYIATGFWPIAFANLSFTSTAIQQPDYAPLKSCPGAPTPCPQEAIMSALSSLKVLLQSPCPACNTWVFNRLQGIDPGATRTSFFQYLSVKPRLWDGTRSYVSANVALCPSGFWNQLSCSVGSETIHDYTQRIGADAVSQTPSDKGKGMQVFFNPAQGICDALSSPSPGIGDLGVLNQATLFHEALHGYTGAYDMTLESVFSLPVTLGESVSITYYLEGHVIPGGASGGQTCGN